ncbi:MAG TPA: hypothetical protein VIY08_04375 [Candidatus Nitrosocosmicus sp.]
MFVTEHRIPHKFMTHILSHHIAERGTLKPLDFWKLIILHSVSNRAFLKE